MIDDVCRLQLEAGELVGWLNRNAPHGRCEEHRGRPCWWVYGVSDGVAIRRRRLDGRGIGMLCGCTMEVTTVLPGWDWAVAWLQRRVEEILV